MDNNYNYITYLFFKIFKNVYYILNKKKGTMMAMIRPHLTSSILCGITHVVHFEHWQPSHFSNFRGSTIHSSTHHLYSAVVIRLPIYILMPPL